eukprot:COSAG04_NODE_1886_length_5305_cov_4.691894_2_plen_104_part_00
MAAEPSYSRSHGSGAAECGWADKAARAGPGSVGREGRLLKAAFVEERCKVLPFSFTLFSPVTCVDSPRTPRLIDAGSGASLALVPLLLYLRGAALQRPVTPRH